MHFPETEVPQAIDAEPKNKLYAFLAAGAALRWHNHATVRAEERGEVRGREPLVSTDESEPSIRTRGLNSHDRHAFRRRRHDAKLLQNRGFTGRVRHDDAAEGDELPEFIGHDAGPRARSGLQRPLVEGMDDAAVGLAATAITATVSASRASCARIRLVDRCGAEPPIAVVSLLIIEEPLVVTAVRERRNGGAGKKAILKADSVPTVPDPVVDKDTPEPELASPVHAEAEDDLNAVGAVGRTEGRYLGLREGMNIRCKERRGELRMCPDIANSAVRTRDLHVDELHAGAKGRFEADGLEHSRPIAGVLQDDSAKGEHLPEIHGEAGPCS
ncbi:MAG: hypothetical protein ACRD0C_00830 [Acidimicrobiia bacterium]